MGPGGRWEGGREEDEEEVGSERKTEPSPRGEEKHVAKVTVSLPLGALCGPGAPIPNFLMLDRFGEVSKCISAYYSNVLAFSD